MSKIIGRRPVQFQQDNLWYMCELSGDYVYKISSGFVTYDECTRMYLHALVENAQLVPLHDIDNDATPLVDMALNFTSVPATHMLKIFPDHHVFLVNEDYDKDIVIELLKENLSGIIF